MPFNVTLPIYAVAALALVAALWAGRLAVPRIQMRAQNEKHGAFRVIELALVLSPAGPVRPARGCEGGASNRIRSLHHAEDL